MALCLALSFLSHSNAQEVLTTGNLVNFTGTPTATTGNWNNGVYVNGLTCWKGGDPGNCGPNPNVQTNGSINFSYGQVNLNQVVNISNALAEAGSGVLVSGFNFGFRAKNGNGWDDGRQDYLSAYVSISNNAGKVVENYDYTQYTNRQYNWSDFNFTETFNKPYDITKLGSARYGFIGRDNNFWAGPYGPEITNVIFSLNYRIDPCVANPASSPTCPGFSNLIKTTSVVVSSGLSVTNLAALDTSSSGAPILNVGGVQLSSSGNISAPDNIPQTLKDVQASTQQSAAQAAVGSNTQQQQTSSSKPNMSLIMSIVGQIQAADKATQAAAVQNANQIVTTSAAKAQEQAMAVVDNLNTMSAASSQSSVLQATPTLQMVALPSQTNISMVQLQGPAAPSLQTLMASSSQSTNQFLLTQQQQNGQTNYQPLDTVSGSQFTPPTVTNKSTPYVPYNNPQLSSVALIQQPVVETMDVSFAKIENKSNDDQVPAMPLQPPSRGAAITESMETNVSTESIQTQLSTETVKKNVQSNDLAGNVDIASIATQPKGYDLYSQLVIKDVAFYKVEDIYKNQRTIDNVRLMRGLQGGSDRLHQEMVDQQYQLGK